MRQLGQREVEGAPGLGGAAGAERAADLATVHPGAQPLQPLPVQVEDAGPRVLAGGDHMHRFYTHPLYLRTVKLG